MVGDMELDGSAVGSGDGEVDGALDGARDTIVEALSK